MFHTLQSLEDRLRKIGLISLTSIAFFSLVIVGHELFKEGYLFKLSDIVAPRITHEKALLVVFVVGFVLQYRKIKAHTISQKKA